jgi:hypothetical protein
MSLERVELTTFVPAAEFHLPEAGEGYMQVGIGHIAFGLTQAPEAPYGVRLGEVPTDASDDLILGDPRFGQNVLPYRNLPRATEPVDLVRGQTVDIGSSAGVVIKSPNGVPTKQMNTLVDNALATAVSRDEGISPVHAQLFVGETGLVSVRNYSRRHGTVVTLEAGAPTFVEPTPAPRFR